MARSAGILLSITSLPSPYGIGTMGAAAKEFIDPEMVNDPVTYPDDSILVNGSSFAYLPEEISRYVESLFMEVRNG